MALEFPCEHNNLVILVLQLKSLNLNVMLFHSEKLKYCVRTFLCFGVTRDQPEHHNTRSYEISAAFNLLLTILCQEREETLTSITPLKWKRSGKEIKL
jgi:hypothetical protein